MEATNLVGRGKTKNLPTKKPPASFHLPHPHRFRHTPVLQPRDCRNHGRHSLRSEQSLGVWYPVSDKNCQNDVVFYDE